MAEFKYPRKVNMMIEYRIEFRTADDEAETALGDILDLIQDYDNPDGPPPNEFTPWEDTDGWRIVQVKQVWPVTGNESKAPTGKRNG